MVSKNKVEDTPLGTHPLEQPNTNEGGWVCQTQDPGKRPLNWQGHVPVPMLWRILQMKKKGETQNDRSFMQKVRSFWLPLFVVSITPIHQLLETLPTTHFCGKFCLPMRSTEWRKRADVVSILVRAQPLRGLRREPEPETEAGSVGSESQ